MTRVNVVPVEELVNKHLMAEYHEITRIPNLVRKRLMKHKNKWSYFQKLDQPSDYTLGTGHVRFFYDKLSFINTRYTQLSQELILRGYNIKPLRTKELLKDIPSWLMKDYKVTDTALTLNRNRIKDRL